MRICRYCFNSNAKPCFALRPGYGYDSFLEDDTTLQTTLSNYDVAVGSGQDKRLVFPPEDVPDENHMHWNQIPDVSTISPGGSLLDFIRLKAVTEEDRKNGAAVIDGMVAEVKPVSNIDEPLVIQNLACSQCHTVLPFKEIDTKAIEKNQQKRNFRVTLVANTSAGKTNLTSALYGVFKSEKFGATVQISEPLFEQYYRRTAELLTIHGILPKSTGHSTPPLSVAFKRSQNADEDFTVDIVDTKGEITRFIDFTPCLRADLIIFLVDIRENDTVSKEDGEDISYIKDIERLSEYISQLSQQIAQDSRMQDKRIILAFSKCDRFMGIAEAYMFQEAKKQLKSNPNITTDAYHKNMRNIRNFHFSQNMGAFVQSICDVLSHSLPKEISKDEASAIEKFITTIVQGCNDISRYQTDIMCVAPLGTAATKREKDGSIRIAPSTLSPKFVDELAALIKFYGGGAV